MNISTVVRSQKRFNPSYLSQFNIQSYDRDNIYPQRMQDLILNSPTGTTCCDRYEAFIEGNGLNDEDFSEYTCNATGQTVDDLYRLIARDMALFHGFALHLSYNLLGQITAVNYIPFQNCRLEEETEDGKVIHIYVHPDWTGKKTRKGKTLMINKTTVKKYYQFNPNPAVVLSEIEKDGGIENYRGQIMWFSMDGINTYPHPIYDSVVTNLSIDEGLDNIKYRNVRNNFLPAGILTRRKGAITIDAEGNMRNDDKDDNFSERLDIFQGDENACSIIEVTLNSEDDKIEFKPIEGQNFDTKFTVTERSVTERIYAAFGQEPWYIIRLGKLGFSGQTIGEAYEYYNSYVGRERRAISRALKKIFSHWYEEANPSKDYGIQPLVYISNASTRGEEFYNGRYDGMGNAIQQGSQKKDDED